MKGVGWVLGVRYMRRLMLVMLIMYSNLARRSLCGLDGDILVKLCRGEG